MPSAWDTMIEFDPQAGNSRRLHDNGDDNNDNNDDNDNGERSMLPNSPHTWKDGV